MVEESRNTLYEEECLSDAPHRRPEAPQASLAEPQQSDPALSVPPLATLYFYLTGDCNMACRHCWIAPKFHHSDRSEKALPVELFKKIVREAKEIGLTSVKLTGGEPFTHPNIVEILQYIKDEDLGLSIESNGVAMTSPIAQLIASCKNCFISVSIDGLEASHEWMRGVPGSFERASDGVRTLVSAGVHPQVIMSVAERNKHEMADLARYAGSLGASSVKYNFIAPVARGETISKEAGMVVSVAEQVELSYWVQRELRNQVGIPLFINVPFAFRSLSSLFGPQGECGRCGIYTILGVLHDGTYALCGIGTSIPELCFGNAGTSHVKDIWLHTEALDVIRKRLPKGLKGICARCLVRNVCLGHCVANNYYAGKDLLAPNELCEEALSAGVFPLSRLASSSAA